MNPPNLDQIDRALRSLHAEHAVAATLAADAADVDGPRLAAPTLAAATDGVALLIAQAIGAIDPAGVPA